MQPNLVQILSRAGAAGAAALLALPASPQAPTTAPVVAAPGQLGTSGGSRESIWWAPTAEDWKRPCLVTWQRSFEDALAVSHATGKPLLVCINMDGEIASEHYAGVRYRQPEIAALYEPYVCVIASVYRHAPRDHAPDGRRVPCPRFGTVTCGEHIAVESVVFEKFCDGKRIAPRHIMVETQGGAALEEAECYDVYYAFDTASVFQRIEQGILERPYAPFAPSTADRTPSERLASAEVRDREAVEREYLAAGREGRRALLVTAVESGGATPVEMLRLAIYGFDLELAALARRALARTDSVDAVELLNDALRVPLEAAEREPLVAALERLAERSPRARTLATVQRGMEARSSSVDVARWRAAGAGAAPVAAPAAEALAARLEAGVARASTSDGPPDPAAELDYALATLARSSLPGTEPKFARVLCEDARDAARRAQELGSYDWRADAVIAVASYGLGEGQLAHERAAAAVQRMPAEAAAGPDAWTAVTTLGIFAEERQQAIWKALREKRPWPAEWMADLHAAYEVLARHELGTDLQVAAHVDLLRMLGAGAAASAALDQGLARFPASWALHERLRDQIVRERGAQGLEPFYEEWLARLDAPRELEWFAGFAAIVSAEFERRAGGGPAALAAYARALEHYERAAAASAESRESCDHYAAMALGGRARVLFESGELALAVGELVACFERRPDAAASLDGLNLSAVDTAKMLRAKLAAAGMAELGLALDAALARLDPALLELPAYERPPEEPGPGRRGR
jgi:hypothetical protein